MLLRLRIKSRRDIKPHILPKLFFVFPATTLKNVCGLGRAPGNVLANHFTPQGIRLLKEIYEKAD